MRNPFRRKWRVEKFRPWAHMQRQFPGAGLPVKESAPAPSERLFWTFRGAEDERDRLNGGLTSIQSRERFRVVERS